jgi:hypothetical protein
LGTSADGKAFKRGEGNSYYFESRGQNPAAYVPFPFKPDPHEALHLDTLVECAAIAEEREGETGPGWLSREIERVYEQIHGAALADPFKPFTNGQFEQAVSDLRTFARYRAASVLRQVSDVRPPPAESKRPINGRRQPRSR